MLQYLNGDTWVIENFPTTEYDDLITFHEQISIFFFFNTYLENNRLNNLNISMFIYLVIT